MQQIDIRLGKPDDVNAAASVYERSNLARRHGDWTNQSARVAEVTTNLNDSASWFLLGWEDGEAVAMALIRPFRADSGKSAVVAGTLLLDLIYVLPERWGIGIGGAMLDAVIAEAARRDCPSLYLWTNELENERAQRLYRSRRFASTGRTMQDSAGKLTGEWLRNG